jgi:hypothetical protein
VPPGMALSPIEKRLMVLHHSRRVSADRGRDLGFGGNQLDTSEDAKRRDLTARYGPDMLKWLTDLLGCRFGRAADMLELARLHASQESTGEQDVLIPAIQPAPRMSTSALVLPKNAIHVAGLEAHPTWVSCYRCSKLISPAIRPTLL